MTVFGGPIETIQAIYVKPAADHWDRMLRAPALQAGAVNTVQLRPLTERFNGFPQNGMIGWGQRLMKLDRLDPSFTGAGVKIGIIDFRLRQRAPAIAPRDARRRSHQWRRQDELVE